MSSYWATGEKNPNLQQTLSRRPSAIASSVFEGERVTARKRWKGNKRRETGEGYRKNRNGGKSDRKKKTVVSIKEFAKECSHKEHMLSLCPLNNPYQCCSPPCTVTESWNSKNTDRLGQTIKTQPETTMKGHKSKTGSWDWRTEVLNGSCLHWCFHYQRPYFASFLAPHKMPEAAWSRTDPEKCLTSSRCCWTFTSEVQHRCFALRAVQR